MNVCPRVTPGGGEPNPFDGATGREVCPPSSELRAELCCDEPGVRAL